MKVNEYRLSLGVVEHFAHIPKMQPEVHVLALVYSGEAVRAFDAVEARVGADLHREFIDARSTCHAIRLWDLKNDARDAGPENQVSRLRSSLICCRAHVVLIHASIN